MTDASRSSRGLRKQWPLVPRIVLLAALVGLVVVFYLLTFVDRPMVVQQLGAPVLPEPPQIDPEDTPAVYREVIRELQELFALGRFLEVVKLGSELGDGAITELLPEDQFAIWNYLGNANFEIGQLDAASDFFDRAFEVAGVRDEHAIAAARASGSVVAAERGDVELAAALLNEASSVYEREDDRAGVALVTVNQCALRLGEASTIELARSSCEDALEIAKSLGLSRIEVTALINLGVLAFESRCCSRESVERASESALAYFDDALLKAEDSRFTRSMIAALNGRGLTRRLMEMFREARNDFQRAIELADGSRSSLDEARLLNNAAVMFNDCGYVSHARELLELAQQLLSGTGAESVMNAVSENLDELGSSDLPRPEDPDEPCAGIQEIDLDEL